MRLRHGSAAVVAALTVLTLAACSSPARDAAAAVTPGPQDVLYGQGPAPRDGVTLQPDVVIVGGGSRSVRSVTDDGLTWRIDGSAEHARDLVPGKVFFVTGQGVGRVLDVEPRDGDLLVTIGPVDLTEVVRDGDFSTSGVALDKPLFRPAGAPFWSDERGYEAPPTGGRAAAPAGPGPVGDLWKRPLRPPPTNVPPLQKTYGYSVLPTCCAGGVGVHYSYDDGDVKLGGTLTLTMNKPTADFTLKIGGGTVKQADLEIGGGFGIKGDFYGGIQSKKPDGVVDRSRTFQIPADLSFPIGSLAGIPLSFTVSQTLSVTPAFGGKLGTVKGKGEFSVAGHLGFGYKNGGWGAHVDTDVKRKLSLLDSISGVPVGVMGLIVGHGVRFTVGISAFVFTAGIYFELLTRYGVSMGSALGSPLAVCRGATLSISAVFGVGYKILEPVVKTINKFLGLLASAKIVKIPPIQAERGLRSESRLFKKTEIEPKVKLCAGPLA